MTSFDSLLHIGCFCSIGPSFQSLCAAVNCLSLTLGELWPNAAGSCASAFVEGLGGFEGELIVEPGCIASGYSEQLAIHL